MNEQIKLQANDGAKVITSGTMELSQENLHSCYELLNERYMDSEKYIYLILPNETKILAYAPKGEII